MVERDRKAEHIRLALESRMQFQRNLFDDYFFEHRALPEIRFEDIDTSTTFLGKRLAAPLLISCMTGGTAEAGRIMERSEDAVRQLLGRGLSSLTRILDAPPS